MSWFLLAASLRRSPLIRTSLRRLATLPQTSFEDPSRPGLFYHLSRRRDALSVYSVSFLKEAPVTERSKTIIGWLPATTAASAESGNDVGEYEAGLHDFVQNDAFVEILHSSIRKALEKGVDESVKSEAVQRQSGWLHINDTRNIPPLGRIGDPDDIIGSVLVENGQVVPSTYQRMPSYRVCTSDGLTQLSEGLSQELLDNLNSIQKREASTSSSV